DTEWSDFAYDEDELKDLPGWKFTKENSENSRTLSRSWSSTEEFKPSNEEFFLRFMKLDLHTVSRGAIKGSVVLLPKFSKGTTLA
ncbi:MAG: hypothetical protein Q9224_003481, partial [Gallowayella concinna]